MDTQRYVNYQFGWNQIVMKCIGIWPAERKWNRPSSYVILLPFLSMVCFVCIPQTMNLPRISHDLNLVVENLSTANVTITMSVMKTVVIWKNGKSLKFLLECIANDWATVDSKAGRETMLKIAKITRTITIISLILCYLVAAFFAMIRLYAMQFDATNKMFVRGYYPYDITVTPNYELTMFGQSIAGSCSTTIYSCVDTFIAMLVLHACGQISNLKTELREIRPHEKTDVQAKLKKIVEKHNYVTRFAETIENNFNVMLLIQMLGCIVQLCFQSFQALMSVENKNGQYVIFEIAFLVYYVICVSLQLLLYCYVGERLMFESTDIAEAAYQFEWYNLPPHVARLLMIIMCQARASPLKITAGKFCWFTILLYSQVVKTAVSYISVLHAVQ